MRTKVVGVAVALAAVGLLAIPTLGSAGSGKVFLGTQLGGRVEVPDPGDPDGKGKVLVKVKLAKGKLCYGLKWKRIETPTAAHIHKGRRGSVGPVKLTLFDGAASSPISNCFRGVKFGLLRRLIADPERFYVNVHNDPYPGGAIRGQLKLVD